MRVLYIYKWCTFGGVERVLINRAFAFREFGLDIKSDIFFVYPGVQIKLQEFIYKHNIQDFLSVKPTIDPSDKYDVVISIDTEEAFELFPDRKITLEVHTTYKNHAKYLKDIDFNKVERVLLPSKHIFQSIDYLHSIDTKIDYLPNFVIDKGFEKKENYIFPKWKPNPICYLGRIDKHKNPHFILEAYNKHRDILYDKFLFCNIGYNLDEEFLNMIKAYKLEGRVLIFPNITFDKVKPLMEFLKDLNGIVVSASIAESFGMSIAEAIYFGVPVLVSDIPPHRELVNDDERFLFKIDNSKEFVEKLLYIYQNYDEVRSIISKFKDRLEPKSFIDSWINIFGK